MTLRAVVKGVGHYLPERVVPNAEFEKSLDTNDEWIRARSGIERRHFAAEGETTSSMAAAASRAALADAGLAPEDVDAIVLATSTADLTFPSAATMVQAELGMTGGFAFDVQAVCAGFVFALANANALILSGQAKTVLVIGAETSAGSWIGQTDQHASSLATAQALCCCRSPKAQVHPMIEEFLQPI